MAYGGVFEDCNFTWNLQDKKLLNACNIGVNSTAGGKFLVYPCCGRECIRAHAEKQKIDENEPSSFHEVKWRSPLHNPLTRKLVNESHGVFVAATKLVKGGDDIVYNDQILKISQRYHSILLVCIEDLDRAIQTGEREAGERITEEEKEEYVRQKILFSEIELLWSLLELLFIDVQSSHKLVYQLLGWLKWHFPEPEKKVEEILKSEDAPYEHPDYWDTVTQFVLHGKINEGRSLLKAHQHSDREDFRTMDNLLRTMPMFKADIEITVTEFRMRWQHWREECRRRLDSTDFSSESNLEILCKILCGDMDTLTSKSHLYSTWYIHLICILLYTDPCITSPELGTLAWMYRNEPLTRLDSIILAAMELDIVKVIKDSCSLDDGWWFITHMSDLFFRKGLLTSDMVSHPFFFQENIILGYADALMNHKSLWQIGVDYLDQCVEFGKAHLEIYLERIPLDTEMKARKLFSIARKRNMDSLAQSISRIVVSKAIRNGMFGTALKWVLDSEDLHYAEAISERWLKNYSETGRSECFEILSRLNVFTLPSSKLVFVAKYCEFHDLYRKKEFKQAASLLVSLLDSNIIPKGFETVILYDALPLMEATDPVFSMEETTQLMACLEKVTTRNCEKDKKAEMFKEKERVIRLALVRNLAKAFIYENSEM